MLVAKIYKINRIDENNQETHIFVVVIHAEADSTDVKYTMNYTVPKRVIDFIKEKKAKKVFFQNQEAAETFLKDAMGK